MAKYRRLKSILFKNNKKYAVDLNEWAEQTLQGADLDQFNSDMAELTIFWETMMLNNKLLVTDITETLSYNSGSITVVVGEEFTIADDYVFPDKETEWYNRMAADPSIIKFNDKELISEV
jgi:hypothetical protein